jgi:hypothetical protein
MRGACRQSLLEPLFHRLSEASNATDGFARREDARSGGPRNCETCRSFKFPVSGNLAAYLLSVSPKISNSAQIGQKFLLAQRTEQGFPGIPRQPFEQIRVMGLL